MIYHNDMNWINELKKDGLFLKEIPKKHQTLEMCEIAVKQNALSLKFVSKKCLNFKLCLTAVENDGRSFRYVPSQFVTKEICDLAIEADTKLLKKVPEPFRTSELCMTAINKDVSTLSCLSPHEIYKLFDENTEYSLIEKIVDYNPSWLQYMPNRSDVRALCIKYMEKDFSVAQFMPEHIKISDDILDYLKSEGKLEFTKKYYDPIEKKIKSGNKGSLFQTSSKI